MTGFATVRLTALTTLCTFLAGCFRGCDCLRVVNVNRFPGYPFVIQRRPRPYMRTLILLCALSILAACVPSPTGPEIEDTLRRETEETLRSATGPWRGVASGSSVVRFEFSLTDRPDGQLQGTGTIREADAAGPVPITVAGTYNRPNLSLTFTGMVYEGRAVVGTFVASYDSAIGVNGTLTLTGADYAKSLPLFLQEGTPAQSSLGGRLTDAVTGGPVVGATVSVQGRSVASSSTGHYGFEPNLMPGTFSVTVRHQLYVEIVQDVEIGPYKTMDFKLQPK